jgi:hypothetical protein
VYVKSQSSRQSTVQYVQADNRKQNHFKSTIKNSLLTTSLTTTTSLEMTTGDPNPTSNCIQLATEVVESFGSLAQHLNCAICLEIMTDCYVVPECLHRFCGACIKKSIRTCKNQCPTCRASVSTQRSLRIDSRFNDLVSTSYIFLLL